MCRYCDKESMMSQRVTQLSSYTPPPYTVNHIELVFHLNPTKTQSSACLTLQRAPGVGPCDLVLDGEALDLLHVVVGDDMKAPLSEQKHLTIGTDAFVLPTGQLKISASALPAAAGNGEPFIVTTVTTFNPSTNTECSGLYTSGSMICTQCEAVGFRRIAYAIDRPDVMWTCNTRILASADSYPNLLCNGNQTSSRTRPAENDEERSLLSLSPESQILDVVFADPFPKPSYLFALVAGDLSRISEKFTTAEGRDVTINVWCEPEQINKLQFAMESILKAMKWDEETFGLCYDLDVFHVVAVSFFNMGAMENKGLNIFNSACLLASRDTSTDRQFIGVQATVAHEYFHNWTGNRVTCRDWFQLTLKEGLTVYRESRFTEDQTGNAVSRIEDVIDMRSAQFGSDAGPLAHPIQPSSYEAIDNLYTTTIYQKGSEVVRMYATLLGLDGFRRGMDYYIKTFDGQAVTCDDFRESMAKANGRDLSQFKLWYEQAGTPVVTVEEAVHDKVKQTFTIRLSQMTPPTSYGQNEKHNTLHIPVAVGLIGKSSMRDLIPTKVLELTDASQTFVIDGVEEEPVLSILRGFSAPVRVVFERSEDDIGLLMAYDSDPVNKWDATQQIMTSTILALAAASPGEVGAAVPTELRTSVDLIVRGVKEAIRSIDNTKSDVAVAALSIVLPAVQSLINEAKVCNPVTIYSCRKSLREMITAACNVEFRAAYEALTKRLAGRPFDLSSESVGERRMRNVLMSYLVGDTDADMALEHYKKSFNTLSGNMTDRMAALCALANIPGPQHDEAFDDFIAHYSSDRQLTNQWLAIQAGASHDNVINDMTRLKESSWFDGKHPTCTQMFYGAFSRNTLQFHKADGSGYKAMSSWLKEVDVTNSTIAAHLSTELVNYQILEEPLRGKLVEEIKLLAAAQLSKATREYIDKAVASMANDNI